LLNDLVKCLMIADPFFIHYPGRQAPAHIAPYITSTYGLYTYRMLLCASGVFLAIDLISSFTKLLQVNILGPSMLGLNASLTLFPPVWGSPFALANKGIRGFWGETWHQMFRKQFVSIGDTAADFFLTNEKSFNGFGKPRKAQDGQLNPSGARFRVRVLTVFLLAGILHAAASYTLLGPTRPWASFLFFAVQPLGMAIQSVGSQLFVVSFSSRAASRWKVLLGQCTNLMFTIIWLWATSGLLLNDLTSGGTWIFEPIPVSFIRGMGFSKEDQRFWCW